MFVHFILHEYFACTYVCEPHICLVPAKVKIGYWIPGTGVMDGCELPPCVCWELNPGPLQGQRVLLTTEPFLQPFFSLKKLFMCMCVCLRACILTLGMQETVEARRGRPTFGTQGTGGVSQHPPPHLGHHLAKPLPGHLRGNFHFCQTSA